jgi:hypothetical protein
VVSTPAWPAPGTTSRRVSSSACAEVRAIFCALDPARRLIDDRHELARQGGRGQPFVSAACRRQQVEHFAHLRWRGGGLEKRIVAEHGPEDGFLLSLNRDSYLARSSGTFFGNLRRFCWTGLARFSGTQRRWRGPRDAAGRQTSHSSFLRSRWLSRRLARRSAYSMRIGRAEIVMLIDDHEPRRNAARTSLVT